MPALVPGNTNLAWPLFMAVPSLTAATAARGTDRLRRRSGRMAG